MPSNMRRVSDGVQKFSVLFTFVVGAPVAMGICLTIPWGTVQSGLVSANVAALLFGLGILFYIIFRGVFLTLSYLIKHRKEGMGAFWGLFLRGCVADVQ